VVDPDPLVVVPAAPEVVPVVEPEVVLLVVPPAVVPAPDVVPVLPEVVPVVVPAVVTPALSVPVPVALVLKVSDVPVPGRSPVPSVPVSCVFPWVDSGGIFALSPGLQEAKAKVEHNAPVAIIEIHSFLITINIKIVHVAIVRL
jgi:hypothetical protein